MKKRGKKWIIATIVIVIIILVFIIVLKIKPKSDNNIQDYKPGVYTLESYHFEENDPNIEDKYVESECNLRFLNLVNNELKEERYLSCNSNNDCKSLSCNSCVNIQGFYRYLGLTRYCEEPIFKCGLPGKCGCINNKCDEI